MEDRKKELGTADIGPLLIRYSAPAMVAMFVNSMYNLVDTIFVGQGVGTLALAALAVSWPVQMIVLAVAMTVGIGAASIISRSLGAGNQRRAERAAGTSLATVGVLAVAIAILGRMFLEPILTLFGASEAVLPYATDYLSVILLGSFFLAFSVCANSVARSEGNVKIAMTSMIIGAVVNVVLDPIFIFGLDMGVRGAAVATVIANICTFTFLCRYLLSGKSMLRIAWRDLIPDFGVLPEMFKIGSASFFQMVAGSLMIIPINAMVLQYGADVHLAILGVGNRISMFFFMPIFGLVQGLQPIIGFNYGARKISRVIEAVRKASLYATILSVLAFIILMTLTRPILSLFSRDAELISEGGFIVRILILFMPFVGFQMVGGSLFQALGKARPALILTLSRQVLVLFPLIVILPRYFGLNGLWASFPIADFVSTMLTVTWVLFEVRGLGRMKEAAESLDEPIAEPAAGG